MKQIQATQAAMALLLVSSALSAQTPEEWVTVDQGWQDTDKQAWYSLSQGSRLIPAGWLKVLEQADSENRFLDPRYTESFRYLARRSPDPALPLPLGFVIDTQSDQNFSPVTKLRWKSGQGNNEPWVGMNCAACHTSEITFQNKRLRIDGAPALADFQGYIKALNEALAATRKDPAKWLRFSDGVLGPSDQGGRDRLAKAVDTLLNWQLKSAQANATDLQYGYARVDAFGHIYNKVLLRAEGKNTVRNPADAPVSYPFLWNIHQHDKVQWNASAPNRVIGDIDIGALGRNVGEVTGVFADLTLRGPGIATGLHGYNTSANLTSLLAFEDLISKLQPPAWPAVFPALDAARWEKGKALFATACAGCHQVLERSDLRTRFVVNKTPLFGDQPIGTDPWMACNAYSYQARSGVLRNTPKGFFIGVGSLYGNDALLSDMLGTTVIGSIYNRKHELVSAAMSPAELTDVLRKIQFFDVRKPLSEADLSAIGQWFATVNAPQAGKAARLAQCQAEPDKQRIVYKGRPLTGVWASPPFLHNGSVPTLYDLLLPPAERPASFLLGTREFDPVKVGFVSDRTAAPYLTERARLENTFLFRTRDAAGNPIAGNSNAGHDYGNAGYTDEDRFALVEYMKAVGGKRVGAQVEQ